ncbi:hypothetical protein AWB61_20805 [Chromobacterium sp. F49]|nr:hypothetical protein AWB61_20805 [Chromobacterium sp. F49]
MFQKFLTHCCSSPKQGPIGPILRFACTAISHLSLSAIEQRFRVAAYSSTALATADKLVAARRVLIALLQPTLDLVRSDTSKIQLLRPNLLGGLYARIHRAGHVAA